MDTFEKTLRKLRQQGFLAEFRSLSDQVSDLNALTGVRNIRDLALTRIVEEQREQMQRLTSGYGISSIARDIVDQELALQVAMTNSLSNLTGLDSLALQDMNSAASLQQQIEDLVSPLRHFEGLFAEAQVSSEMLSAIRGLEVSGGLIGEFAYSYAADKESAEAPPEEDEYEEREEVESRIIQVEYLPQRVFDAIRNEPKLMRGLDPRAFEEFTAELLSKLGFKGIWLTPQSGDGGRDIVATQVINDIPVVMAFECKRYAESNKIGPEFLRALLGTITQGATRASMGVLVTTSSFTSGARSFIAAEASIDGKDFDALAKWLLETN
jgi:hypothetical protein